MKGKVYLVGAGPGRPELLTLRGAECLAEADVVLMDALVNRRLLVHCRPGVKLVESGKRGHGRVFMGQAAINRLMARLARSGKTVARLKGGDPYFFGRGGEEADYLARRRVPFEVVPGVSSVSAVPAYAGVPLTHRALTSSVTVVTGHAGRENTFLGAPARRAPAVEWDRLPAGGTLVILMGTRQLSDIARRLMAAGWSGDTPVSVVQWGTWPEQRSVEGPLRSVAYQARRRGIRPPSVIVIGSVVGFRRRLNWFERLPLFGRTVVVTRAESQAPALTRLLEADGARVLESPAIRIEPLPLGKTGRTFLRRLHDYDGVLFTSVNSVRIFLDHRGQAPWPRRTAVYAIGLKTARALVDAGLPVHGVAREFVSESLRETLGEVLGKRYLLPRAEAGRDLLPDSLKKSGARVDVWPLYRTRPERLSAEMREALRAGAVDCVTFTSSSTARYFLRTLTSKERRSLFRTAAAASIGPVTSRALREHGIAPTIRAARSTVEDLAAAVRKKLGPRRRP